MFMKSDHFEYLSLEDMKDVKGFTVQGNSENIQMQEN